MENTIYGIFIILNILFGITTGLCLLAWNASNKMYRESFWKYMFPLWEDSLLLFHIFMVLIDVGALVFYLGKLLGNVL